MKHITFILTALIALGVLQNETFSQTKKTAESSIELPFDKAPEVQKQVHPKYPASMLEGGWEATVYVKAYIETDGSVADAKSEKIQISVIKSAEKPDAAAEQKTDGKAFEEAALAAVKQWKFSAAQMKGKPVAAWVTIPFRFKLSADKVSPKQEEKRAEMEKTVETLKSAIENILQGKELDQAKKYISPNASLVYNTEQVNLYSIVNGENNKIQLKEGKESQCINFNVNIAGEGSSMLLVWTSEHPKGKNKRVHSITLAKNPSHEWKIIHWHTSF